MLRTIRAMLVASLGFAAAVSEATAQEFPSRPITVVVPFPAGGPSDALVRIMGEHMRGTLGQPMVVENIGGARATSVRGGLPGLRPTATR